MKFFVSFLNSLNPEPKSKASELDKILKTFDNKILDFTGVIQTFYHIRQEIDLLDERHKNTNNVGIEIAYDGGGKQMHAIKFIARRYTGYLFFKRID